MGVWYDAEPRRWLMVDSRSSRLPIALLVIALVCAGFFALYSHREARATRAALAAVQERLAAAEDAVKALEKQLPADFAQHLPDPVGVRVITEYYEAPMTAGPFPTTTVAELVAHFSTELAQQTVARWMRFTGHPEWTEAFHTNLPKASLRLAPMGTVPLFGVRTGDATGVLPYVAFGMPLHRTDEVQRWIAANGGGLTYWSVPVTPDVSVGVLTLSDALFLPFVEGMPVK